MSLVSGKNIKLANNTNLLARNAADSADVPVIKVNASDKAELPSGAQVSGTPSNANDIANKSYVDSAVSGISGFATTSLNNLASTAVNADIIPAADGAVNLGSAAKRWLVGFIETIKDASSVIVLDAVGRLLKNAAGNTVLDFSGTDLSVNTRKITSVSDPTNAQDAATKAYVDANVSAQKTWVYEALTLNGTDITNQYKDLANVAVTGSIFFHLNGVWQRPTTDYTISYTGGVGGKTRLTFAGDLATGGNSALVSGDVIHIQYQM